jgi:hypothetical protein
MQGTKNSPGTAGGRDMDSSCVRNLVATTESLRLKARDLERNAAGMLKVLLTQTGSQL